MLRFNIKLHNNTNIISVKQTFNRNHILAKLVHETSHIYWYWSIYIPKLNSQ